jgi:hypothetical protein
LNLLYFFFCQFFGWQERLKIMFKIAQLKIELTNVLADMMLAYRRIDGISEDVLLQAAYKHIAGKLDALVNEVEMQFDRIPVTDLVHLDLPFQAKENPN